MRARLALTFAATVAMTAACTPGPSEAQRRAEVERAVAQADGGAAAAPSGAAGAVTRATSVPPAADGEPPPAMAAWAASIAREIDGVEPRSRQLLSVQLLQAAADPRQKGEELTAYMQWCDERSLSACLHVGHVLLFNECLFDRARGFYEKASALAGALPREAVDPFMVDGRTQRAELALGMQLSDPARRDDEQVRALAAVCGAVAERDRPLWDDFFARYASGAATRAAGASTSADRLALGALRKKMLLELDEQAAALGRVRAASGQSLRARVAATASALCGEEDPLSCGTASYLYATSCRFDLMEDAYRRYEAAIGSLDAGSRQQATRVIQDALGPARGYAAGDPRMRDLLRRSLCGG